MDFSKINMPDILKSGMKNKFQDFPPSDFEDFIAQLFRDNGYDAEKTPHSGDYGADVILSKAGEKIAVQVKRFAPDNKVGVKEINQVIGSKDFYKCNRAMILTTSEFSTRGQTLANETSTELWDWNKLQKYICDTYLEGKDYYGYFSNQLEEGVRTNSLDFEFVKVNFEVPMKGGDLSTLIYTKMINVTDRNIHVVLTNATFISVKNEQVEAKGHLGGYFHQGVIYAGATVELSLVFKAELLSSINAGDRVIFKWVEDEKIEGEWIELEKLHTYDMKITCSFAPVPPKTSWCYIVTMCFGTDSAEYREMIFFRDNILGKYYIGNKMISAYYRLSKVLVKYLKNTEVIKMLSRFILRIILIPVKVVNRRSETCTLIR